MGAIMYRDKVYGAGGSGGGGSTVAITPTLATGTKIADFEIDGTAGELYAPQGGGCAIDYSTVEQDTGQKWVDGKKIYQKTYVLTTGISVSNNSANSLPSEVYNDLNPRLDTIIDGHVQRLTIQGARNTACVPLCVWKDTSAIKVYSANSWNNMTHFTFRYTKTTD